MDILTLNCGSSSLKYQLSRWDEKDVLASGIVERVTVGGSFINHYSKKSGKKVKRERGCPNHKVAIEYLGAYAAAIGKVDAIVCTAGVGERGPITRAKCLEGLENMGIVMDAKKNEMSVTRNAETEITGKSSKVRIFVIPTDEELVMTEGTCDTHTNFTYSFQHRDHVNKARAEQLKAELKEKKGLADVIARIPAR